MISFESVLNTVLYVGAIQGIILSVILFNVKTNKLSNRLLGTLTFLWAVILSVFALQSIGIYNRFPHLLRVFFQLLFAWFPLLFLSVKYLFSYHKKFNRLDGLHFLPMIISVLLHTPFYMKTGEEKILLNNADSGYYNIISIIGSEILSVQGIVYSILSLIIIRRYKKRVVDFRSSLDDKIISGYRTGVILALIAWCIGITGNYLERFGLTIGVDLFLFVYLIFVAIIYWLSILTLRSPEVFKLSPGSVSRNDDQSKAPFASQTELDQTSEHKELSELNLRLINYINMKKPYLNPDLSLDDLSRSLGVGRHQLSAVINQYQKMNFFELINSHRVKEVKSLIADPSSRSKKMYELGYEAGFNSKASFYRVFKQMTHKTPAEYRATMHAFS